MRFVEVLNARFQLAAEGQSIVALRVKPTHAETGYGYIEGGDILSLSAPSGSRFITVNRVRRFREKSAAHTAERIVVAGTSYGTVESSRGVPLMLCNAAREHIPDIAAALEVIAGGNGTPNFRGSICLPVPELREHLGGLRDAGTTFCER